MYSIWIKQKYPDAKRIKLVWYFLAYGKEMISERSDEQLEKLKLETEEIIKEIIRERLIRFAQRKGIDVVWGTDRKVSVKPFDKIDYPKTKEFIQLLKEKGLFEEVVVLNTSKLRSQILKRGVDTDVLEQLKTEQGWIVRLSLR